ncbi:MAG: DNA glycosylase, partial [Anaerovoracaceae bacterium]
MIIKSKINLKLTQESGQTSQPPWVMVGNDYCELVFIENIPVLLKVNEDNGFLAMDYNFMDNENDLDFIIDKASFKNNVLSETKYLFDLDFDLDKFYKYLGEDDALRPSIDFCNGLRLFKARDPFECIISSICSANNSIARWTKSISEIRRLWGKKYTFSKVSKAPNVSRDFYTFPSINSFKNIHEDELAEVESSGKTAEECNLNLKSCGVGYRASYMKKTAEILSETSINEIKNMDYDEAFETVLDFPGVGPKV